MGLAELVATTRSPLAEALQGFAAGQSTGDLPRENAMKQLALALQQRNMQRQDAQDALESEYRTAQIGNMQAQRAHAAAQERQAASAEAMKKAAVADEHYKGSAYHDPSKGWVYGDWEKSKQAAGMTPDEASQFPIPPSMYPWVQKWEEDRTSKALQQQKTQADIQHSLAGAGAQGADAQLTGLKTQYFREHGLLPGTDKPETDPANLAPKTDVPLDTLVDQKFRALYKPVYGDGGLVTGWKDAKGKPVNKTGAKALIRAEMQKAFRFTPSEVATAAPAGALPQASANPDEAAAAGKVPGGARTLAVMRSKWPPDVYARALKALASGHSVEEVSAAVNQVIGAK